MGSSPFFISEVVFGPEGYAVVTNGSEAPADPAGMQLCQFPAYPDLPAGPVAPGESLKMAAQDLGDLDPDSGELALYVEPNYAEPEAIVFYVQWGSADHKRQDPAIEAGVWPEGSFVDASGAQKMVASGHGARAVDDWTVSR